MDYEKYCQTHGYPTKLLSCSELNLSLGYTNITPNKKAIIYQPNSTKVGLIKLGKFHKSRFIHVCFNKKYPHLNLCGWMET